MKSFKEFSIQYDLNENLNVKDIDFNLLEKELKINFNNLKRFEHYKDINGISFIYNKIFLMSILGNSLSIYDKESKEYAYLSVTIDDTSIENIINIIKESFEYLKTDEYYKIKNNIITSKNPIVKKFNL